MCPKCHGQMVSSVKIRRLGWFSVIIGMFLVAMMIFVIIWEVQAMLPGSEDRYTGTRSQAILMFLLESDVLVIGLVSIAAGVWQIKHGERNKTFQYIAIGLVAVAVIIGIANLSQHNPSD